MIGYCPSAARIQSCHLLSLSGRRLPARPSFSGDFLAILLNSERAEDQRWSELIHVSASILLFVVGTLANETTHRFIASSLHSSIFSRIFLFLDAVYDQCTYYTVHAALYKLS